MKQYRNKKSSSRKDFINLHIVFLAFGANFLLISEELKISWWGIGLVTFMIVFYFYSLIKLFADIKQEFVLEFNEQEIFFNDINTRVLWEEVKSVELVYKTFKTIANIKQLLKLILLENKQEEKNLIVILNLQEQNIILRYI